MVVPPLPARPAPRRPRRGPVARGGHRAAQHRLRRRRRAAPEIGLYAAIGSLLGYAAFGSGRRLVVGPDAAGAAIIAAAIPAAASPDDRVRLASVLALLVAALFVAMRVARVGFLADFLSRPILVGYLTGVGITVGLGQLPTILGGAAFQSALDVLARSTGQRGSRGRGRRDRPGDPHLGGQPAVAVRRRRGPRRDRDRPARGARVPVPLIAVVVAIAASFAARPAVGRVRVLGPVRPGLPPLGIPLAQPSELLALLPGASPSRSSRSPTAPSRRARSRARTGERADANRELVGMAAADGSRRADVRLPDQHEPHCGRTSRRRPGRRPRWPAS